MMLQNRYSMNVDINNKEEINYVMLITSMSQNKQRKKMTKFKTHGIMWKTTNLC